MMLYNFYNRYNRYNHYNRLQPAEQISSCARWL